MMKQIYTCVKRCFIFSMLFFISSIVNASDMTVFNEPYQPGKDWESVGNNTSKTIQVKSPLNGATIKFYNVGKMEEVTISGKGTVPQIQPITQATLVIGPGEKLDNSISENMDNNPYPIYNLFPPDSQLGFSVPHGAGSNVPMLRIDGKSICSLTEKCVTWHDEPQIWVKYNNEKNLDSLLGLSVVRSFTMDNDRYAYQSIVEYNEVTGYIDIEDKIFNLTNKTPTLELVSGVRQSSSTLRYQDAKLLKDPIVPGDSGYEKPFEGNTTEHRTPLKQVFSPTEVTGWNYFNTSDTKDSPADDDVPKYIKDFFDDVLTGGLFDNNNINDSTEVNKIRRPSVMYGSKEEVQPNDFISTVTHYYVGKEEQLTLYVAPNKISRYPGETNNKLTFTTSFPTSQTNNTVCLYKGIDDKNLENTGNCDSDPIEFSFEEDELPQALSQPGIVTKNYFFQTRKEQGIGPSNILNVPIDRYTFGATVLGNYRYEFKETGETLTSDQVQNLLYPYYIEERGDVSYKWVAHADNTCKATDNSLDPNTSNEITLPNTLGNYTGCLKMEQKDSGQIAYISVPIEAVEEINNESQLFLLHDNITLDPDWQNVADSVKSQWILQESKPYVMEGNKIISSYTEAPDNFHVSDYKYNIRGSRAKVCYYKEEDNLSDLCDWVMINKIEYLDIWDLNNDPYKDNINKLRPATVSTPPVFDFQKSIPSQYNFVMRQTDAIKVAIPESASDAISVIHQDYGNGKQQLLDVVFKPNTDVKSIDFYLFNMGQIVQDSQYKDVHAKVTLTVGDGWNYSTKHNLHLTFYDFTDMNSQPQYFLRLLRTYERNTDTFQAPVTIQYNFYTNESSIDWEQLSGSDDISIDLTNTDETVKQELQDKGLLTYYKYKDINQIEDAAHLTEASVNGYWLFSRLYNTIDFELLPGEKFTQLYAADEPNTTVLFSQSSLVDKTPPILKITGNSIFDNSGGKEDQLLMTYEGNNFGYTYRGIGTGGSRTLGITYSSDIPNKIEFSAPEWIQTNYEEVSTATWDNLSYSFIQNIPFYSGTDIKEMRWTIPDPDLSDGPFELGETSEGWKIYNENDDDVTDKFIIEDENNRTTISTKEINAEFYNHNYKFSRKLTLKIDGNFSKDSKDKGQYVVKSPGNIEFFIQYKEDEQSPTGSYQETDIFDMNIESTLDIQCYVGEEEIHNNQCTVKDDKEYFLLDTITKADIPQTLTVDNQGYTQEYTFTDSDPEILPEKPFVIKSSEPTLTLYYEKPPISISVPQKLEFEPIQGRLSSNPVISKRKVGDWQVEITGIKDATKECLVYVTHTPFSYEGNTLDNAKLIYKAKEKETELDNKDSVCIDSSDFSYNNGVYQTGWGPNEGLLFQYTYGSPKPVPGQTYTSKVTFTLNIALQ